MNCRSLIRAYRLRRAAKQRRQELQLLLDMNRDLFPAETVARLTDSIAAIRAARGADAREKALEAAAPVADEAHDLAPKRPSAALFEIVETLVVAFGVAMAFRAYFFQPFKIPTGSMQPTLYGMHSIACAEPDFFDSCKPLKAVKWLFTGRWYRDVVAHRPGTLSAGTDHQNAPGFVILSVAGERYNIPSDAFDRGEIDLSGFQHGMMDKPDDAFGAAQTPGYVRPGDRIWSGYVISGDQVFVNRLAWNFHPPRRDDICVFSTSGTSISFSDEATREAVFQEGAAAMRVPFFGLPMNIVYRPIKGLPPAQHYIKRLVGLPGETISIDPPHLLVNGEPVTGLPGIDRESSRACSKTGPLYPGYHNTSDYGMPPTAQKTFLATKEDAIALGDEYLPMGDNTPNSYDGRYWGPVPRTQMLGPAACVYWPISCRWGRAR